LFFVLQKWKFNKFILALTFYIIKLTLFFDSIIAASWEEFFNEKMIKSSVLDLFFCWKKCIIKQGKYNLNVILSQVSNCQRSLCDNK